MRDTTHPLTNQRYLALDYTQSLQQMIAAGHYDWTNPNITADRFLIKETGPVQIEARLFHFDRYLSSADAVAAVTTADAERPWIPATIEHLLVFGAAHPDEQRRYPIIALGSVAEVDGDRYVPYLDRDGAERDLHLGWWDGDWDDDDRFLAVRNLPSVD